MHPSVHVTATLQRLFFRVPTRAMLFRAPAPPLPPSLHGEFVDTRPVVFRNGQTEPVDLAVDTVA